MLFVLCIHGRNVLGAVLVSSLTAVMLCFVQYNVLKTAFAEEYGVVEAIGSPSIRFSNALLVSAQATFLTSQYHPGEELPTLDELAKAVVQDVLDMKDTMTGRKGKDFQVDFSAVVWPTDWGNHYGTVLKLGSPLPTSDRFTAANGMIQHNECPERFTPPARVGKLGWPCPSGGSVAVTQFTQATQSRNCMIFYVPQEHSRRKMTTMRTLGQMQNWYTDAMHECKESGDLNRIWDRRSTQQVDLNIFAKCLWERHGRMRGLALVTLEDTEGAFASPRGGVFFPREMISSGLGLAEFRLLSVVYAVHWPEE